MDQELLTIKQYAKKYNISVQAVYKRLNGSLKDYVIIQNGKKYLRPDTPNTPVQASDGSKQTNTHPDDVNALKSEINALKAYTETLQSDKTFLQDQIAIKDNQVKELTKQVSNLTDHISDLTGIIRNAQLQANNQPLAIDQLTEDKQEPKKSFWKRLFS